MDFKRMRILTEKLAKQFFALNFCGSETGSLIEVTACYFNGCSFSAMHPSIGSSGRSA